MKNDCSKVSVVFLTLNAEPYLRKNLQNIEKQTLRPIEVIVVDSESVDNTIQIAREFSFVKIVSIKRSDFDHGGTRHLAVIKSIGDIIVFFSQDVEIFDIDYLKNIVSNFKDDKVAMVYGRQIPRNNATPYEKLIREFNYPELSKIKSKNDIDTLGIKCFFMSDVCSAYRRNIYYLLGGFEQLTLISEDMLIATKAIMNDYKVIYDAHSAVYHSHNYSFMQELRRNFDIGVFLKMNKKYYSNIKVNTEGVELVKYVSFGLIKHFMLLHFFIFLYICLGKFIGNKIGLHYHWLPKRILMCLTSNKNYWDRYFKKF